MTYDEIKREPFLKQYFDAYEDKKKQDPEGKDFNLNK